MQTAKKQGGVKRRKPLAAVVPGSIRRDPDLSELQKILLGVLHLHGGEAGTSNQTLADRLNVHPSTVARNLRALDDRGYIERDGDGPARVIRVTTTVNDTDGRVYVTRETLDSEEISISERYLLARVYGLSRGRGYASIKSKTLAFEMGTTRQAVEGKLKALREAGFIVTTTQNRRHIHPTKKAEHLIEPEPTTKTDTPQSNACKGVKTEQRNDVKRGNPQHQTNEKQLTTTIQSIVNQLDVEPQKPLAVVHATKKKATQLQQKTSVDLDRDHLRTVVFTTAEDVQEVIKAYEAMDTRKPSAALQTLLTKAVNGELNNDHGSDVSLRAKSIAEEKTNALLQSEGADPDTYMAHLFDENPAVANQAYGAALDVVLNGEARHPLRLFTHYANRLLNGEGLPDHDDKNDEPERSHRHIT